MHPNTQFRQTEASTALAFAADQGFGVLMVPSAGLHASHIPFVLSDDATALDMHLVRSNPLARALTSNGAQAPALLAVQGPHAYISPDWYGVDDQVPTWNYVAVHLTGRLVALDNDALRDQLTVCLPLLRKELPLKRERRRGSRRKCPRMHWLA